MSTTEERARARECLARHGCAEGFKPEQLSAPVIVNPNAILEALVAFAAESVKGERERIERALRIYPEWCKNWGMDRNMRVATEAANECADMLKHLPPTLPDDDEHAGCAIASAIRSRGEVEQP